MEFRRAIRFSLATLVMPLFLSACSVGQANVKGEALATDPPPNYGVVSAIATSNITPKNGKKIRIALLLYTSNSMDGLITQAKAQLWKLVSELSLATYGQKEKPSLEIALYEYGNAGLSYQEGYVRQVS